MKKVIMDKTGTCRDWLRNGRGLLVWESHDIGSSRPDLYTPADHAERCGGCATVSCRKPHWAYVSAHTLHSIDDALFYTPEQIIASWRDTPAGCRAAERALARHKDSIRPTPSGTVYTTHTIHHFAIVAAQITPSGTTLDEYVAVGQSFLSFVEFRVGVRRWTCVDEKEA